MHEKRTRLIPAKNSVNSGRYRNQKNGQIPAGAGAGINSGTSLLEMALLLFFWARPVGRFLKALSHWQFFVLHDRATQLLNTGP